MHRPILKLEGAEAARESELGNPELAIADQDLERFDQSTHVLVCDALLARSNMVDVDRLAPHTQLPISGELLKGTN